MLATAKQAQLRTYGYSEFDCALIFCSALRATSSRPLPLLPLAIAALAAGANERATSAAALIQWLVNACIAEQESARRSLSVPKVHPSRRAGSGSESKRLTEQDQDGSGSGGFGHESKPAALLAGGVKDSCKSRACAGRARASRGAERRSG